MTPTFASAETPNSAAIRPVAKTHYDDWLAEQPESLRRWLRSAGFKAEAHTQVLVPSQSGELEAVVAGLGDAPNLWSLGHLPLALPEGTYRLELDARTISQTPSQWTTELALGWLLGSYQFSHYKPPSRTPARLIAPLDADITYASRVAESIDLVRNLINMPPADMMPSDLALAAETLARSHNASCKITVGDKLLKKGFAAIHTVGRASADEPRLIDIRWGHKDHPKVTLVGKGVCFDSGGLDIKSSSNMALMKKDMGGAAHVLGLAKLIMEYALPVRLRVLIPAVENAISGNAFRTSDVIHTYKGLTVEVGNTDAEGRLILCDALALADEESPDLMIDCATLTGAARVALGTEIPALFTNSSALGATLVQQSLIENDPLWMLPLWEGYRPLLKSSVADISSTGTSGFGGAITAALYLKQFVENCPHWLHLDMMAWNSSTKPGRPEGGEAMGLRALFNMIRTRYQGEETQ